MAQEEHSRHRIRPPLFAEAELSNSKSRGRRRPLFGVLNGGFPSSSSSLLLPFSSDPAASFGGQPSDGNL